MTGQQPQQLYSGITGATDNTRFDHTLLLATLPTIAAGLFHSVRKAL